MAVIGNTLAVQWLGILGGLNLQWFGAGSQFPSQRLKSGHGSNSTESLDHQMMMTAHPCEYTENRWIVHFEWFVSELYLGKAVIGEGDGTSLQYSCLENPMDRGAW